MLIKDFIKSNFLDAIICRCFENDCGLQLNALSNYVILKGEKISQGCRICDCIVFIFAKEIIIGIVELKSKTVHSSEIKEKLTNGSEIALNILEGCNNNRIKFEFYHVVLAKRWHSSEYKAVTSKKIMVRGKRYDIIAKKCGESLSTIISCLK